MIIINIMSHLAYRGYLQRLIEIFMFPVPDRIYVYIVLIFYDQTLLWA